MNRLLLASSLLVAAGIALACTGPFGQNGLDAPKDGTLPIPLYEAGAPIEFDGSLDADAADDAQQEDVTVPPDGGDDEGGDASDGSTDAESDAASDGGEAG
jgi:hypothetical protein